MINEKLVQQVREGKASIWVVDVRALGVNNRINTVKGEVYPKSPFTFERAKYFYFRDDRWYYANTNPTGLEAIPLDRFFEEEDLRAQEQDEHHASLDDDDDDYIGAIAAYRRDHPTTPQQPSLPSGAQTMPGCSRLQYNTDLFITD